MSYRTDFLFRKCMYMGRVSVLLGIKEERDETKFENVVNIPKC